MYSWKYSHLKGVVLIIEGFVFVQTKNSESGSESQYWLCLSYCLCALDVNVHVEMSQFGFFGPENGFLFSEII